ncbi:hypothetical protein [Halochromatium glycolicum]|uniref:Uncharacterized protein n=1 Tax=Halochromatium glycolicum TaxID=85075 RepID=A0AAJ0U956_9GAMM|nr:hypothetical protein [Halochromatium glycolicum]MBK1707005.1 hypothetical protein [Halochromatium glycolicum]
MGYHQDCFRHRRDEALMEYYVLLVEKNGDAIARVIGSAPTSSAACDLAQDLDVKLNGRVTGRTFYLDHEALIAWRTRGKVAPIGSLIPEVD